MSLPPSPPHTDNEKEPQPIPSPRDFINYDSNGGSISESSIDTDDPSTSSDISSSPSSRSINDCSTYGQGLGEISNEHLESQQPEPSDDNNNMEQQHFWEEQKHGKRLQGESEDNGGGDDNDDLIHKLSDKEEEKMMVAEDAILPLSVLHEKNEEFTTVAPKEPPIKVCPEGGLGHQADEALKKEEEMKDAKRYDEENVDATDADTVVWQDIVLPSLRRAVHNVLISTAATSSLQPLPSQSQFSQESLISEGLQTLLPLTVQMYPFLSQVLTNASSLPSKLSAAPSSLTDLKTSIITDTLYSSPTVSRALRARWTDKILISASDDTPDQSSGEAGTSGKLHNSRGNAALHDYYSGRHSRGNSEECNYNDFDSGDEAIVEMMGEKERKKGDWAIIRS